MTPPGQRPAAKRARIQVARAAADDRRRAAPYVNRVECFGVDEPIRIGRRSRCVALGCALARDLGRWPPARRCSGAWTRRRRARSGSSSALARSRSPV